MFPADDLAARPDDPWVVSQETEAAVPTLARWPTRLGNVPTMAQVNTALQGTSPAKTSAVSCMDEIAALKAKVATLEAARGEQEARITKLEKKLLNVILPL